MKRNIDVLVEQIAALSKELFQEVHKKVDTFNAEAIKEHLKGIIDGSENVKKGCKIIADEIREAVKNPEEVETTEMVEEEASTETAETVAETPETEEKDWEFTRFCRSFKVGDSGRMEYLTDLTLKDLSTIAVIKFVVLTGFKSRESLIAFAERRMTEDGLDKEYIFNAKDQVDMMLEGKWRRRMVELWTKILRIETAKLEWSYKGPLPEEDEVLEDKEGEIAMGGMGGFINLME
jgi:hypothetical protein